MYRADNLHSCLMGVLRSSTELKFHRIELQLISLKPLMLADSTGWLVEMESLREQLEQYLEFDFSPGIFVILYDWGFEIKQLPDSGDWYFDAYFKDFR